MRPSRSAATWAARVGLTRPERFAEGATSGTPAAAISARATGWLGARKATLSRPARASRATRHCGETGATRVSGPGQNACASARRVVVEGRLAHRRRAVEDMGDQRIEDRPALGGVNRGDRALGSGVPGKPVDRLGRHGDEAAGAQDRRRRGRSPRASGGQSFVCRRADRSVMKRIRRALVRQLVYI